MPTMCTPLRVATARAESGSPVAGGAGSSGAGSRSAVDAGTTCVPPLPPMRFDSQPLASAGGGELRLGMGDAERIEQRREAGGVLGAGDGLGVVADAGDSGATARR